MSYPINGPGAVSSEPGITYTGTGKSFSAANATVVTDQWLNMVDDEINNVVIGGGQTPTLGANNQMLLAIQALIAQSSAVVGEIRTFALGNAPSKWLLCYGQAVSRTSYNLLYAAIGTTYGSGNGTTTFNVPDLRGRTSFGVDNMGGTAANRITTAGSGINGSALSATGGSELLQSHTHANVLTDPTHTHTDAGHSHTNVLTDPKHTHTDSGHTHTNVLTDPKHTHTDSGHVHNNTLNDPSHGHLDSGHNHNNTLYDPGHNHYVNDPGHQHSITGEWYNGNGTNQFASNLNTGSYIVLKTSNTTYAVGTGIYLSGSNAGLTLTNNSAAAAIQANTTGITLSNASAVASIGSSSTGVFLTNVPAAAAIQSNSTGITLTNATATAAIQANTTGITLTNASTGSGNQQNMPPAIMMIKCIYAGQ
jgi:microcystin-dependent protein